MNANISGPLISLIVPVYNVKDYLKTCLQSILEQTYKNLDIILVDDGSDDGSSSICDEFARMDQRIKTIHLPHSGVSAARNAGLAAATGELLGFVDSDDWTMGEDLYKTPNTAIRDLKEPKKYNQPEHMNEYKNYSINYDRGGVHINSGIPNKAAYNTITKLGKEKAEKIYYRALTKYLTRQSDFSDASHALTQSAKDLYGDKEANDVQAAWNEVGVN
ncbi:MAG: M4 family metallopeptidase, partial [Paeniclostridium sordellii]|nr:M4 family metallopeptidase [Paeniclostridium sordellii]